MQERLPSKPPLKHNIDDSLPRSRWIAWGRIHPAAFGILMMAWLLSGTAEAVTDTFTASGNWTAPAGVTSVTVEAWGGGGAGGGATGNPAKGGGGAGGQYASKTVTVIPGNSYTITVGSGGTASTGNGNPGGDSIFGADAVVAKGGAAGGGAASNGGDGTAGAGSTSAGIGDVVYAGGNGAAGSAGSACNTSGAGGGGAGSTGAGGNATGNTGGTGTATGGGSGGNASNSSGNGGAGSVAGGAGSGACAESNTDRSGGSGARGQVWVSYALPPTVTTGAATSLSVTEATLNGTVTSNGASTTVTFDYGLTTAYGSSAAAAQSPLVAGASGTAVSAAVTGLACNTTYHFRAKGVNSAGTTNGNDLTFTTSACPTVTSIDTAGANPTNAASVSWTVIFSSSVTGVSSSNFTLVNSGLGGTPAITGVSGSGTSWTVTASTGTGTGTLGLNLVNATGISPDVTTSTFTGQVYSIDNTAPVVSSIARINPTPTSLTSVSWAVAFSESVTGVDTADFALAQSGGVSGAAISSVSGSGTAWVVTASTGSGTGTLGLNLVDDDTVIDAANNPLGGAGAANGSFTGETYTIAAPSSSSSCVNDTGIGSQTWSTLTGPLSSDNTYATASVDDGQTTNYLKCTGYGFSVPVDAVIEGITVGVERFANNTNVRDASIRIVKNNNIGSTNKSTTATYPTTDPNTYVNYGGAADLWGETWTPADINSANFGAAVASQKSNTTGGARTVSVDHIVVTVAYRQPVNCTSNASGNWSLASTWVNCRSGVPLVGDTVTIASGHTVTLNVATPAIASLTINSGGTLTASAANTLTLGGNLINNGTLSLGTFGSVTLTAASQWTGTGATWTLNNLTLGSQALSFNATDTFILGINGSIGGLGSINSGGVNTGITIDFSSTGAQTVPTVGVTYPNLTVSGGGTKTPSSGTLDVRGNFSVAAGTTFAANTNNPAVSLAGNFSNSATFNAGTGVWSLIGTSAQSISGTPSFSSLTINNASGVSLSSNATVATALTLTSGAITTGANTLIYSNANCATSPIIRTSGYVIGNLRLTFPAASTACTFPVGSGTTYAPIQVTNTGAGTLTGSTTGSDLPPPTASNIDANKDANRYWTLWASGDTIASTSYTPTFNFASGDLDSGADATDFIVGKLLGSTWSNPTMGSAGATSTTTAAITGGFGGAPNVFVVGQFLQVNCTSNVASGNWNTSGTWTSCRGGVPIAGDTVTISSGHNVTLNVNTPAIGTLTVNGTLTNSGSNTMTLAGDMEIVSGGAYSGGSGAVSIAGNLNNAGTFTSGSATWTFDGSTAQSISGAGVVFNKLTLNNSGGLTLNSNVSVTTLLTLTSGILNTGVYKLTVLANCPGGVSSTAVAGSGASTDKFVYGNLQLTFPTGTTTCTYNIGTGSAYAPVGVTLTTTLLGGGTLTATTYGSEHPQLVFSGIEPNRDANRYWTLGSAAAPADTIGVSSYSPTFHFTAGDLDAGATSTNFSVGKYAASTWTLPSPVTANAYSTVLSTINASLGASAVTDFMVGESTPLCTVPEYSPTGTTCQCDFFNRTTLNPSTIFGGNWNLSSTGATTFTPQINTSAGHMQLTPNSNNVSTAATLPGTFPAAGNMISVEFKLYAYGGTAGGSGTGADGIALTLSDSNIPPVAGAFGGSLGYAQKCQNGVSGCVSDCSTTGGCPGFAGGWIGIGIDEFGNFSNNSEGRTGGSAPGQRADSIAVRGSGSGQAGYPYLTGTTTLTPGIDNAGTLTPSYGHAYRLIVDARDYTPSNRIAIVKLDRDATGNGTNYNEHLVDLANIYTTNPAQADVPVNWVFSYTGSTGGSKNIHEIASLKVCGQTFIPPAGYRILVDNLKPTTCAATGSPTVTISALDNNGNVITGYDKTVVLSATLLGGGASHASLSSQGSNHGTWVAGTNSYTFAAADYGVAKFTLTDSTQEDVYITVSEYGGTLNSTSSDPVQYRSGVATYTLANIDNLASDTGGGVVAGRPHRFRVTRNLVDCGGVDTSYNGRKYLDGWYTPASGDHPSGAGQPQVCTMNVGGSCLPASGSTCQTMSIAEPTLDPNSNNMPMDFSAGISDFCLVTNDVGKYSIYIRDDTQVPSVAAAIGTSSTLTARPFSIVVSDIFQGSALNPASSSATESSPFVAGMNFSATVGGYLWNSSADSNGGTSGLPGLVTKSTMITAGLAPHYADTVTLAPDVTLATNFVPNGSGTVPGTLSGGAVTVANGSGAASTLNYNEVGSFTLKATPSSNYLNSGIDLANRVSVFADNVNLNRWVGRFRPSYFDLSGTAFTNRAGAGCVPASEFTYMGEPMNVSFTLTAKNALGATTQNYIGDYVKFSTNTGPAWVSYNVGDSVGLWAIATDYAYGGSTCKVLFDNLTPSTNSFASCSGTTPSVPIGRTAGPRLTLASSSISAWSTGVATFSTNVTLERGDTQDGPYETLKFGVAPQDSDGVQLRATDLNLDVDNNAVNERALLGTAKALHGRVNLQNAFGSELLDLPMSLIAEYWNGNSWVTNTDDQCTTDVTLSATDPIATDGLVPAELFVWDTGSGSGNSGLGYSVAGTNVNKFSEPPNQGNFNLNFRAPGSGNTGSLDIAATVPNYLKFNWKGAGNENPTALATFGIFKGNSRFIYFRELY